MKHLLAVCATFCLALTFTAATNYDAYLSQLYERNRRLHDDHLAQFPELQEELEGFNAKHALQVEPESEIEETDEADDDLPDIHWNSLMNDMEKVQRYKNAEVPSQNNLWGEHKVSGGTGKGSQYLEDGELSKPEVKTDKLPAYCDPPNPCPVNMDPESASSPCDRNIPDTKSFNKKWIVDKMNHGECPCDNEHMQHCERSYNRMMNQRSSDNPFLSGNKRAAVAAKKAPPMWTDERKAMEKKPNPFLEGELHAVKKKDGRFQTPYMR